MFLCIASFCNCGYVVRTGIPIGWNYGLWYGITSSYENVKKFCATVNLNEPEPMTVGTWAAVQSCKVLASREARGITGPTGFGDRDIQEILDEYYAGKTK